MKTSGINHYQALHNVMHFIQFLTVGEDNYIYLTHTIIKLIVKNFNNARDYGTLIFKRLLQVVFCSLFDNIKSESGISCQFKCSKIDCTHNKQTMKK